MKRFLTLCLIVSVAFWALSGCGCDDGRDTDLVFVNDWDATIVAVLVDFADQGAVTQRADSCPLKRGETFGFQSGVYPVTVAVYDRPLEDFGQKELGSVILRAAPPEGERWYVTAKNSGGSLTFTVDHTR